MNEERLSADYVCRVCRGSGHLSPGLGARDQRDYGKTCYWCEGSGTDHDPDQLDSSTDASREPR